MKPWAYAVIIVVVIAFIGGVYAKGHSAGYNKRDQQVQQQIIEAQELARQQEEARWANAVAAAQQQVRTEEVVVERIRNVEIEVPRVVREIVEIKPECRDLGADFAGLLNDQVRAANGVQDPEVTAGVVDRVP